MNAPRPGKAGTASQGGGGKVRSVVQLRARVGPGGRVEVESPELREGESVDVLVLKDARPPGGRGGRGESILHIIGSLEGRRLFESPEEVDEHIRQERDSWER